MKKIICLIAVQLFLISLSVNAEIKSNMRLLQKPEWDGAVFNGQWLNTDFRYQSFENDSVESDYLIFGPTFATSFPDLPGLELGMRFWLMNTDYDYYEDEFGVSDIDCWGKYQFFNRSRLSLTGGFLFTLPSGGNGVMHNRASGEVNFEMFGSARFYASDTIAIIGHVGIRKNSDMNFSLSAEDDARSFQGEIDGEIQFEFGGGAIVQVLSDLNILGELNVATEAYEDSGSDFQITTGAEYIINSYVSLKSGVGFGLDDGAPDMEIIIGCAVHF